jgi:hypothetical protein
LKRRELPLAVDGFSDLSVPRALCIKLMRAPAVMLWTRARAFESLNAY